jgi:menaquinone-dependent protoporphyrinogen oxidase
MKVLVTAASRHGSTADIAAAIVRVLHLRGVAADLVEPVEVTDLSEYDAVVLGSAVYAGRWMGSATDLVARCRLQLAGRPVWLFSSGPVGIPANPALDPAVSKLMEQTGAQGHRVFAGRLDKAELGRLERTMVRAVRAPEGDYRDWAAITEWATEIADSLAGASSESPTG